MRKSLIAFLCFNIMFNPSWAVLIEDEFVNSTLDKNLKIEKYAYTPLTDEFASKNTKKNMPKKSVSFDEILPNAPKKAFVKKKVFFDENNNQLKVRIKEDYSTKSSLDEGDFIDFITLEDVVINNKTYKKGSIVKARLETISKNKSYGVPADLVVGNFQIDDTVLSGEIKKQGANRSLWLYPTVSVATCFFGLGLLLIPIRGGHAKIKQTEVFNLNY